MNFKKALFDLYSGNGNTLELTRKHHLNSQQIAALEAASLRVSDSMELLSFPNCAIRMQ
jgi:hypothetical protein